MIRLKNVTKRFPVRGGHNYVARNTTFNFPSGKSVGLLGRNGAGKSTMLNMIAGLIQPTSGEIIIEGSISWPVGFAGSFHRELTGAQNVRFLARIYGVDTDELIDFVRDFSELGPQFFEPLRTYSSGMRSRLTFGVSMGIHFDTYLVDEITAVGDSAFRSKAEQVFMDRMTNSGAVFVSHGVGEVRRVCEAVAVLEQGGLRYYRDVEEGIKQHERNMRVRSDQN